MENWNYWMAFFHIEKLGLVGKKYVNNWSVRHSMFSETNVGCTVVASSIG